MKTALIQINSTNNKQNNLNKSIKLIEKAISKNAKFILLPEVFHYRGDLSKKSYRREISESIPGLSIYPLMELAKKNKVFILVGSLIERARHSDKAYNTSVLINAKGQVQDKYRKINLFHATVNRTTACEAQTFLAGNKRVLTKVGSFNVGLSVCYDLRFPELYQAYSAKGAHVLTIPSSFTHKTGQAHWESLLRARAIENHCYVLAPNQIGKDGRGILCFGNSMIIDPWGTILAKASSNKEEIIYAHLKMDAIKQAKKFFHKK